MILSICLHARVPEEDGSWPTQAPHPYIYAFWERRRWTWFACSLRGRRIELRRKRAWLDLSWSLELEIFAMSDVRRSVGRLACFRAAASPSFGDGLNINIT